MLELSDVVKHYRSGDEEVVRALDGISMSVDAGEMVSLYGPSGSGKTTLLTLVAALMAPDSGTVLVDGREVSALGAREAARYRRVDLGYVSQAPDLLPGVPAIDNAALKLFGLRLGVREAHRRVRPLMERLGLGDRLHHRAEELSVGQRQRVLLARALSTEPKLILADEPTGSLDADRSLDVLALFTEVCRERRVAMLLVTHDPQAVQFSSRVHALEHGRLAAYEPRQP
jgi:putative ABC transport system ATP-binding protein